MHQALQQFPFPTAIVGGGISGQAVAKLLQAAGASDGKDFTLFDEKLLSAQFSKPEVLMSEFQPCSLIVSPGVPLNSEWIQSAQKSGVLVTSELDLAALFLSDEKIIGVTGSLGKSTCTMLFDAALEKFSNSFFVGGNLGIPLARYAEALIQGKRVKADWIVLELSSYQIENLQVLPIDFCAITYFAPNHLERYSNLESYYQTKWNLAEKAKHAVIINTQGGDLLEWSKKHQLKSKLVLSDAKEVVQKKIMTQTQLDTAQLVGQHNRDNIALVAHVMNEAHWPSFAIQGPLEYPGLAHRLEFVGEFNGIRVINDSKATAMESVLTAAQACLEKIPPHGRVFLLLGGRDKKLPWQDLKNLSGDKICPYFFGECRAIAQEQSALLGPSFEKLSKALPEVISGLKAGDTLLLSPGGSSLDEFKNFEERGNFFKNFVIQELKVPKNVK